MPAPATPRCTSWGPFSVTVRPSRRKRYLHKIAAGELRLQAFAVTEPDAGLDTTRIRTSARRDGDNYVISGQKIWTSRALESDLMLLLARTSPPDEEHGRWWGLSTFLVDLAEVSEEQLKIVPIETMLNHNTTELFIDELVVPAENRIGEEGMGFRYILDGMNAERILIGAECASATDAGSSTGPPNMPRSERSSVVRLDRTRASPFRWPGPPHESRPPI